MHSVLGARAVFVYVGSYEKVLYTDSSGTIVYPNGVIQLVISAWRLIYICMINFPLLLPVGTSARLLETCCRDLVAILP